MFNTLIALLRDVLLSLLLQNAESSAWPTPVRVPVRVRAIDA